MKRSRDLLVLSDRLSFDEDSLEHEIQWLNNMLYETESFSQFCTAHELIDINRYRITASPLSIQQFTSNKKEKPFQFLFNKN